MNKEIVVISNSPLNDIHEFVSTLSFYVKEHKPNVIFLNDGTILKFHSHHNLEGIHNYYYFKEVFESFLKKYLRYLQQENAELKEVNNYSKRELYKINKDRLEDNLKLVEENERLKNRNEFLEKVCVGFDDKYEDYKSRCEKLREYINTHQLFKYIYDEEELFEIITDKDAKKDLENILNGVDKDEQKQLN